MRMSALLCAAVLLAACSGDPTTEEAATTSSVTLQSTTTTLAATTMAGPETTTTFAPDIPSAEEYLLDAIEFVEANALFTDRVNWGLMRSEAVVVARDARTPAQLYTFIGEMLAELGDRHSYFNSPSTHQRIEAGEFVSSATVDVLDSRIGYVRIDGFDGGEDHILGFASETQEAIGAIASDVCGWVIDLRSNGGGNTAAMLGGLGPLLERADTESYDTPEGLVAYYIHPDEVHQAWRYHDGTLHIDGGGQYTIPNPVVLDDPDPPTAVLIGGTTRSAGEFTLIALMGQPDTRTFGWPTFGVPTANLLHELNDGAALIVTAAQYAGLDAVPYDPLAPINPDETGGGMKPATSWLLDQPACQQTDP